ncbi:Clp protease ClpP [Bacteroidales bacterium OttesenSCG-928-C19]|nr:Clp protease ClpP [Bacteroidales bacterium OttesenSCG-928-C19]
MAKKQDGKAEVYLYGEIDEDGEYSASNFVRSFNSALAGSGEEVALRVNTVGGDVLSGVAMRTSITNSPKPVTCYIDGIAASMGSVIALSCSKVLMNKYARLMTHQVQSVASGTATQIRKMADVSESLTNDLADIIATRKGITADEAKAKYLQEGVDTWFTAEQALAEGLIDGIFDGVEVTLPAEAKSNTYQNIFQAKLINKTQKEEKRMKKPLLKRVQKFVNVADETEEEIVIEEVTTKLEEVTQQLEELEKEKSGLEAKLKAQADEKDKEDKEEVETMAAKAVEEGKMTAKAKAGFLAKFGTDKKGAKEFLDELPKYKAISDEIDAEKDKEANDDFAKKSWKELDKEGKLPALKAKNMDLFKAKFKAEFGRDFKA